MTRHDVRHGVARDDVGNGADRTRTAGLPRHPRIRANLTPRNAGESLQHVVLEIVRVIEIDLRRIDSLPFHRRNDLTAQCRRNRSRLQHASVFLRVRLADIVDRFRGPDHANAIFRECNPNLADTVE